MELRWDNSLTLHIKEIDQQHQKLFEMIDSFYNEMRDTREITPILKMIRSLKEYADYHFKAEENWMKVYKFSQLELHASRHKEFKLKILEFESQLKTGKLLLPSKILDFVKDWIFKHVKMEDQVFANYLKHNKLVPGMK